METAIVRRVAQFVDSHPYQCRFRANVSTKTVLLCLAALTYRNQNCMAVLDLKSAYENVPREELHEVVRRRVSRELTRLIDLFPGVDMLCTVGEENSMWTIFACGALQCPNEPDHILHTY